MEHTLIKTYIEAMQLAWSPSTLRSEAARLRSVSEVLDGNPSRLWDLLAKKELKPYTKLTYWTRVSRFWDWLLEEGHRDGKNEYAKFRRKNARLFRGVYVRKTPRVSYSEAYTRIQRIEDAQVKEKALQLLTTGCRYTESFTLSDGRVVGKGGKNRRVYSADVSGRGYTKSYAHFRRRLADVELKPHDLRKIFMNEAVRKGANTFELCALAGWANLNTAQSYIEADENRLEEIVRKING